MPTRRSGFISTFGPASKGADALRAAEKVCSAAIKCKSAKAVLHLGRPFLEKRAAKAGSKCAACLNGSMVSEFNRAVAGGAAALFQTVEKAFSIVCKCKSAKADLHLNHHFRVSLRLTVGKRSRKRSFLPLLEPAKPVLQMKNEGAAPPSFIPGTLTRLFLTGSSPVYVFLKNVMDEYAGQTLRPVAA